MEPTLRHYAAIARILLRADNIGTARVSSTDQIKDGVVGRYVAYGRNHELRIWIPYEYALMEASKEKTE